MSPSDEPLCSGPSESNTSSYCDVCGLQIHGFYAHQLPHLPWGVEWSVVDGALVPTRTTRKGAVAVRFDRGKPLIMRAKPSLIAAAVGVEPR